MTAGLSAMLASEFVSTIFTIWIDAGNRAFGVLSVKTTVFASSARTLTIGATLFLSWVTVSGFW